jgi:hypothetical protein
MLNLIKFSLGEMDAWILHVSVFFFFFFLTLYRMRKSIILRFIYRRSSPLESDVELAVEAINGGLASTGSLESSCDRCRYQAHLRNC